MLTQTSCKNTLLIVGANKGGVGKTLTARTILEYMAAYPSSCRIFDTEPGDGVLKRFYPPAETVNPTDALDLAKIIDGLDKARVTLVDIRAGLLTPTLNLLQRIGLKHGTETHVAVFHVIGNTVPSLAEIGEMDTLLKNNGDHIAVLNHATPETFFPQITAKGEIVEIAYLDAPVGDDVDRRGQTFINYCKDTTNSRTKRGLVEAWQRDNAAAFDKIGLKNIIT